MNQTISRRSFVGASAAGIAATTALSCVAYADEASAGAAEAQASWRTPCEPVADADIAQTIECEVGIIGLGHAGLAVMRAAAEGGASVVAVEMQPEDSWWTIGHDIGNINSEVNRSMGIPDADPVEFANNWMVMANNKANGAFISHFAQHSGEAVDWWLDKAPEGLVEQMRPNFFPDNEYTVHELNNGLRYYAGSIEIWPDIWDARAAAQPGEEVNANALNNTEGLELKDIDRGNLDYVKETFADTVTALFETKACYLTKDGDAVSGFVAEGPDGYVQVRCSKGVVLAGGGFGGNEEMRNDLLKFVNDMYTPEQQMMCMFDRDGSAIAMGVWAGGRLEPEISSMNFDTTYSPDVLVGPLWVDRDGNRFQNEAFGGTELNGLFMARAKRGNITSVFDSSLEEQLKGGIPCHSGLDWSNDWDVPSALAKFQGAEGKGAEGNDGYFCADTLEELADDLGFEGAARENFLAAVEAYNAVCEAGVDTDFGKDPHFLHAVVNPPFYAHQAVCEPGFALVTTGGFVTTNEQQVLDEEYQPIEGLYATGNCCGLRFGPTYITPVPGVSVGMCYCLGRKLGSYLAERE